VRNTATVNDLGRYLPTTTAGMRPRPERELDAYGGARLFRGKRVLDIGTGDGRLALGTAAWARDVVGLDPDPTAIRGARANARRMKARNVRFVVGPAQSLPFGDGAFDVVILSWAL
jgi:ubiquinone/menaquinone biosynthesis C-methylase UbiE